MIESSKFKQVVKAAYDKNNYADEYRERNLLEFEKMMLDETIERLSPDSNILDLGCGSGYPYDKYFSDKGFSLLGVDFSSKQIEIAKQKNPSAIYVVDDISTYVPNEKFSLILALFSILHIPRNEHKAMFEKVYEWLKEDGLFLLTISNKTPGEIIEREFTGENMLWSYFDHGTYMKILKEIGFTIVDSKNQKDCGLEPHDWVLLKK